MPYVDGCIEPCKSLRMLAVRRMFPGMTFCSLSSWARVLPWSHDRCTSEVEVMTTQSKSDAPLHATVRTHLDEHVVVHIGGMAAKPEVRKLLQLFRQTSVQAGR